MNVNERKYGYKNKCYTLEDLPTFIITDSITEYITESTILQTEKITELLTGFSTNIITEENTIIDSTIVSTEKISDSLTEFSTNILTEENKMTEIVKNTITNEIMDTTIETTYISIDITKIPSSQINLEIPTETNEEKNSPIVNAINNCNNLYYIKDNEVICIDSNICPEDYPYLKIESKECTNCPVKYKGICYISCPEKTCIDQNNGNLDKCIDKNEEIHILGDICFYNFPEILDTLKHIKKDKNNVISNTPLVTLNMYNNEININEAKENNPELTFIDLGECDDKIKKFYNLDINEKLYILSVDSINKISNQPINNTNFKIYLSNKTELEYLSICNNTSISISLPITDTYLINFEEAELFNSQGYNIYDLNSDFYTDKCTPANINGNDIPLDDRKSEIYPNNISFCPNGCELNKAELEYKRLNCTCNVDYNYEISSEEEEEILNIQTNENFFAYLLDKLNYKIFECPNIFRKSSIGDYFSNIGFYIGSSTIFFNILCLNIFFCCFLSQIRIKIYKNIPDIMNIYNKALKFKKKIKKNNNNKSEFQKFKPPNPPKIKNNKKITKKPKLKMVKKKISNLDSSKSHVIKSNKKLKLQKNKKEITTQRNFKNKNISFVKIIKEQKIYNINNNKTKIIYKYKKNNNNLIIRGNEEDDINIFPYTKALRIDKRTICAMFFSIIKTKIEIISLLFYPEEYTHKSLTLSVYSLDFLFSYFMNALLYSDDVVSQKYHNNGKLEFITSLSLSLISNIVSSFGLSLIKKLANYNEYLLILIKDVQREQKFIFMFKKIYKYIKIKAFIYFKLCFILSISMTYYLIIFCHIYKKSQISLLTNYFLGIAESLLISFGIALIICFLRFISLHFKLKKLYRTSVYLNGLF